MYQQKKFRSEAPGQITQEAKDMSGCDIWIIDSPSKVEIEAHQNNSQDCVDFSTNHKLTLCMIFYCVTLESLEEQTGMIV